MSIIVRFTGDDFPHALLLEIQRINESEPEPWDLDLFSSIEFAFNKANGDVIIYQCIKDENAKSGTIYIPFEEADTLEPSTDGLDYDVQVVFASNNKKKTLGKGLLILNEDVNKT